MPRAGARRWPGQGRTIDLLRWQTWRARARAAWSRHVAPGCCGQLPPRASASAASAASRASSREGSSTVPIWVHAETWPAMSTVAKRRSCRSPPLGQNPHSPPPGSSASATRSSKDERSSGSCHAGGRVWEGIVSKKKPRRRQGLELEDLRARRPEESRAHVSLGSAEYWRFACRRRWARSGSLRLLVSTRAVASRMRALPSLRVRG